MAQHTPTANHLPTRVLGRALPRRRHRGKPATSAYYGAAGLAAISGQVLDTSQVLTAATVAILIRWAHTDTARDTAAAPGAGTGTGAVTSPSL